jgi:predicted MFS family arabinose efflux permease
MAYRLLLVLMCVYLGLTLTGMHAMGALLPRFIDMWSLSETEAGLLTSAMFVAYIGAIPLIALTEKIDVKSLLLIGAVFNIFGYLGFALLADGLWSGIAFRVLQGIGFGLTYMPGVKAISDRVTAEQRGRSVSIYVSSFATTTSFSFVLAILIADAWTWRGAFLLPAITNGAAFLLILFALPRAAPEAPTTGPHRALLDFRDELRNPLMRGYFIAATMHTVELLAAGVYGFEPNLFIAACLAGFLTFIGMPTSMAGGEYGHRRGFAYASGIAMACSAIACAAVGFSAMGPLMLFIVLVLIHNCFVLADSGALNGGAAAAALPGRRGAAITLMAFANAIGSFIGPLLFGFVLDVTGGRQDPWAWGFAFMSLSLCVIVGVAALNRGRQG